MRLTLLRLCAFAALVLPLAAPSCEGDGVHVLAVAAAQSPRVWERFESVGYVWPTDGNAFDPAVVSVVGELEGPQGQHLELPGFPFRDFDRTLVGGFEKLAPHDWTYWKVRATPTAPGTWRWRWHVSMPAGETASPWQSIEVAPAAPGHHGFLRVSPEDARYLRFDDGAPYFAIGENLSWYDGRGTFAYDDWFAKLAAQGVTFVRLWMPSWAFGLEWIERGPGGAVTSSSLGDYSRRLDRAWQLDTVLEAAERHGIYVMLSIQNHGAFSLTSNSEWNDNPYRAENGGPLAAPSQFFTDARARELFKRRLRNIVARWGYSPNVLSWELWNEVDLAEQPGGNAVLDWHTEMAGELRRLDPYAHLLSTSTALAVNQLLWQLPVLDLTNLHFYSASAAFNAPIGPDFSTTPGLLLATRPAGKPALFSELGVHSSGPAETLAIDPQSIGFHDGLWSPLFAGTYGTGMSWWWDSVVDPQNLYPHFGAVAEFVRGVAFDREGFVPGGASANAPGFTLLAQALRGRSVVLVWIKNTAHQWWPTDTGPHVEPVPGATVSLTGLADGDWLARWIDTYDGHEIARESVSSTGGALALPVPTFSRDVALRLERVEDGGVAASIH
jgi:hypothetical protein